MYSINYTHQFKKDMRKCAKRGLDIAPVRGQAPGMQMVDANASAFFVTPTGFNNVA